MEKHSKNTICYKVIIVALAIIACCCSCSKRPCIEVVNIEEQHGLTIYTPLYKSIEMYCDSVEPSTKDTNIIFVCSAAFTTDVNSAFSHKKIVGSHISNGVYYYGTISKKELKRGPWGAFEYHKDGSYAFTKDLSKKSKTSAGFVQYMVISNGQVCKKWRKNSNIYRVLCEKNNQLHIVESIKPMRYYDFVDSLAAYGAKNALYLDVGGWDYGWYRDCDNDIVENGGSWHEYCTNCLIFKK